MDISSFNEKALLALKYHQLLKLSSKHNIKKRWAKKVRLACHSLWRLTDWAWQISFQEDLVKGLLALRENVGLNDETLDNTINEELEWTDGKEALKDIMPPQKETGINSRSTFTIEKTDLNDSRATYNLPKNTNVFSGVSNLDPRLTFDVPKKPAQTEKVTKSKVKMLTVPMSRPISRYVFIINSVL